MGNYSAEAETFSYSVDGNASACSCCPFPPTCLVEPSASNPQGSSAIPRTDASNQFGWGAMQFAGERLMNVAWITNIVSLSASSIDSTQSLADGGAWQPARGGDEEMPNSALSLMRELNYDPRIGRAPTLCCSHCIR